MKPTNTNTDNMGIDNNLFSFTDLVLELIFCVFELVNLDLQMNKVSWELFSSCCVLATKIKQ